jgi:hypothetical protein
MVSTKQPGMSPEHFEGMFGSPKEVRERLLDVFEKIKNIQSLPESTTEEKEALEGLKKSFVDAVVKTIEKATIYHQAVEEHVAIARHCNYMLEQFNGSHKYKQKVGPVDQVRTRAHNSLMSQMNSAIRIANLSFSNKIDTDDISDDYKVLRDRMEKANYERIDLPEHVFSKYSLMGDRDLYAELANRLRQGFINEEEMLHDLRDFVKEREEML